MASRPLAKTLLAFLSGPSLDVSDYCVFQSFYCYSDIMRARADRLCSRLEEIFRDGPPSGTYSTFLLWGDTGVGKSFLVEQAYREVAARTKKQIEYRVVALHEQAVTSATLVTSLAEVKDIAASRDVFLFVDEIDAWQHSYAPLHDASDWTRKTAQRLVLVFAGSAGNSVEELEAMLRQPGKAKGKDLVERIRIKVALPRLDPLDKIVIAASIAKGRNVQRIDKAALFALGWRDDIRSSRAIQQLIDGALSQTKKPGVITYWSIFASEADAFNFCEDNPNIKRFVREDVGIRIK